jgi:DNA-binding CsgD family transcriptional regulator
MTSELFGRDSEAAWLRAFLSRASTRGGVLEIVGEPGIGKSTMLKSAIEFGSESGFLVSSTSAVESEMRYPYLGLHELLTPFLDQLDELPTSQQQSLLCAFGLEGGLGPDPFHIALAALHLIARVSTRAPVLLAIDDLHWLDAPSREALRFIGQRIGDDPVAVVTTARMDTQPLIENGAAPLRLDGLDLRSARYLLEVSAVDLSDSDRSRILNEALGNPLALIELSTALRTNRADRAVGDRLPMTARLERAFAGRLAELPQSTRDAVLIAAIDDTSEELQVIRGAGALTGTSVGVNDLTPAIDAGLIQLRDGSLTFRHPLVRSAVLRFESLGRIQLAHAALASALDDDGFRQAWHRAQSLVGPDDAVADALEYCCGISLERGSVASAITALERAAALTTDSATEGRRLLMAAELAFGLGQADAVDRLLSAASRTTLTRLEMARMEWLREIFSDGVPGDATRVFELCEMAALANASNENDLALNLLHGAALRCWWADAGEPARMRVVEEAKRLRGVRSEPRYLAVLGITEPILCGAEVNGLLSSLALEKVRDPDALRLLGEAAHATGDTVRASDLFNLAESEMRQQGRLGLLPQVLAMQAQVQLMLGDWGRARAAAEEGRRLADETGQFIWSAGAVIGEAMVAGLSGDSDRALEIAAGADRTARPQQLNVLLARIQLARAFAMMSTGLYAEAYQELSRMFDPADIAFHHRERLNAVMYLAEAASYCDRTSDAVTIIAEMEKVALVTPAAVLHIQLQYARPVLATDDDAGTLFEVAVAQDLSQWPWPRARLDFAYGSWLRRQGQVPAARGYLQTAHSTFMSVGARLWADRARLELHASGVQTAAEPTDYQPSLSSQELQIARLAADRLSNGQIAERLFISQRAAASHLQRIFTKLNVTSRAQLADRLSLELPTDLD